MEKLTRKVILLCHQLANLDTKDKSSTDIDEQLQALILEMLQLQYQKQSTRRVGTFNFSKGLQFLESGYISKKSIERDLDEIIGDTKEIDSGPALKSA